ncbi:uncharacterized protein LOC123484355 isoform X3 [Coregonus clupeaformis]|uniref:uncharacterized protein LOC123484355 isoform X3 n=1 Tax=Coregonus clupeaformis TaxID=59861 RepID=UPI001E1C5988|nr:uncharacterized protein LOC123484355 isoform X3 [Coregonus clupeaformis]
MAQLSQKGGLCNMKMLLLAVIFCLLSFVAANVLVSSEHKTLMPVKDHPILNNPDATKETNFKSLLEQLASLRVKDDSSPGNVGQLTKGYSSKNVIDHPDFDESLPLNYVPEHKPLMPVKDHSVQNNPDATKETNFKSLLEQLASLRVKDDSSPGNVGQLTKGYSSKNVIDHPDFDESLPLNYVPEHKPLMPVKDHSVQNNPDATKETNFKSLLEQLASLRVKDDSSPEHKPLMPVKDHSVQNNPDATKETNFKSLLEQLASLRVKDDSSPEHKPLMPVKDHSVQNNPDATKETNFKSLLEQLASLRVKDDSSPGNVGLLTKGYSSKNVIDHPDFDESLPLNYVPEHKPLMPVKDHSVQNNPDATKETNFKSLLKSTLKIKPRVNILTDPSYSEPLVKVNLILGPVFYSFIVIVVLYEAVRISKEARRRSDAIATAWLTEVCVN